jgi:hypothetical protein
MDFNLEFVMWFIQKYGFIKSRMIQDCLAWSFEYLHHCKAAPNGAIVFKLDCKKALDLIEHSTIL